MNATVTLPLSEIDGLRDELKSAKAEVINLNGKMKQMQVKVTEAHYSTEYEYRRDYGMGGHSLLPKQTITEVVLYKNLDEVIEQLRQVEQKKVETRVNDLSTQLDTYVRKCEQQSITVLERDREIRKLQGEQVEKKTEEDLEAIKKIAASQAEELTNLRRSVETFKYENKHLNQSLEALKKVNEPWYKFW